MGKGKTYKDLFEEIAKKHGVSGEDVKKDIEEIIADVRNNPDPEIRAEFKKQFGNGMPTPEEFIYVVTKEIKKGRQ